MPLSPDEVQRIKDACGILYKGKGPASAPSATPLGAIPPSVAREPGL